MKILVVGDAILDHYIHGSVNRQSPEDRTIPVVDIDREEHRLGGCLNVAANIRSISPGTDVFLSSVFSRFTGKILEKKGILSDASCVMDERSAGVLKPSPRELVKTRVVDANGKHIVRIDNKLRYDNADIELFKSTFPGDLDSYDAIVVSDYNKGLVNGFTLQKLKGYKGEVFVDTKQKDLSPWKNFIVKINQKEYREAENWHDLKRLIVTMGEDGAFLSDPGMWFHGEKIESPDVIGAGDVFLAGLVVSYMENKDLHKAINFANMVAAKSVKQKGTTEVSLYDKYGRKSA